MGCECKDRIRRRQLQGRKPMLPSVDQCVCDCQLLEVVSRRQHGLHASEKSALSEQVFGFLNKE